MSSASSPFPAAQVFATLPCHQELGRDLTEYDVVGLHTRTDVEQLTDYLTRELHARDEGGDVLSTGTRRVRLLPCPIGIGVMVGSSAVRRSNTYWWSATTVAAACMPR